MVFEGPSYVPVTAVEAAIEEQQVIAREDYILTAKSARGATTVCVEL